MARKKQIVFFLIFINLFSQSYYFKDKKIKECFVCFGKSVVVKTAWKNKEYRFFELTKIPLHISCKKELND